VKTRLIPVAVGIVIVLGACSSSSKSSPSTTAAAAAQTGASPTTTEAPTTAAPTTSAPTTAAPTTTAPASTEAATTTAAPAQSVTITPANGLSDQQVVHIVAKGYAAGQTYAAVECADKGTATGPGDCDLHLLKEATADSSGTVTVDFPAQKGPFGDNSIVCSAAQKCLISVENAGDPNNTEVASGDISFAA
jgi:hypothetical protein